MFKNIIEQSKWSESHGADSQHLGMGAVYYTLPYVLKAETIVCLGSGAGFVPKLMVEAQKLLFEEGKIPAINVHLIDANIGPWGLPVYNETGISDYPDINLIVSLTDEACDKFEKINYLHVDADHSYEQIYRDLTNYGSRMDLDKPWAITIHDTYNPPGGDHPEIGSYRASRQWAEENGHDFVNFLVGCGTGLIMPRIGR